MIAIEELVANIGNTLVEHNQTVTTVESCTAGGVAHALTIVAGSSAWFERGFVTYSNQAKCDLVGVDESLIDQYGAVSLEVAIAMAVGGRKAAGSDYSISVTGVAGPDGGTESKPVGTVCFAWALADGTVQSDRQCFSGDRHSVREQSIIHSLTQLDNLLHVPSRS